MSDLGSVERLLRVLEAAVLKVLALMCCWPAAVETNESSHARFRH